jgi:hypothetical protein
VKVGDDAIYRAELVWGPDEETSLAGFFGEGAIVADCAFEGADAGGSHSPNSSTCAARFIEYVRSPAREREPLLVHHVVSRVLDFDRLERARAHMEENIGALYALGRQILQQLRREV